MQFIGIIPARYASTRFPGKPLALIGDQPMIERVYRQASKALDKVVVATDDHRIYDTVIQFGGQAVMTREDHKCGTDRCLEAYDKLQKQNPDLRDENTVIINIQGDEPFIQPEQIEAVKKILDAGFAYESNGSIYFDVAGYNEKFHYGVLSGRTLDDTLEGTRTLDGQSDKKAPCDFALWKKAEPQHIMRWPSPWGEGFPGWHLECSVMGEKYLGREFDIHGGGMDLMFPHHECEIAQNQVSRGTAGVHYWVHNNMVTVNGQKMGKSLGNFITLFDLYRKYSPMTIRFFILQAHYRGTLDFSDEALTAAQKGFKRLMQASKDLYLMAGAKAPEYVYGQLPQNTAPDSCPAVSAEVRSIWEAVYDALCDDLNTPMALASVSEAVRIINSAKEGKFSLAKEDLDTLVQMFDDIVFGVMGLRDEDLSSGDGGRIIGGLMEMVLEQRAAAKEARDWTASDHIRDSLKALGITVKDTKDGVEWTLE